MRHLDEISRLEAFSEARFAFVQLSWLARRNRESFDSQKRSR
jgi:hypothetical protein